MQGRNVVGEIMAIVNKKCLSLKCVRLLHECISPILVHDSETLVWKNKKVENKGRIKE